MRRILISAVLSATFVVGTSLLSRGLWEWHWMPLWLWPGMLLAEALVGPSWAVFYLGNVGLWAAVLYCLATVYVRRKERRRKVAP